MVQIHSCLGVSINNYIMFHEKKFDLDQVLYCFFFRYKNYRIFLSF